MGGSASQVKLLCRVPARTESAHAPPALCRLAGWRHIAFPLPGACSSRLLRAPLTTSPARLFFSCARAFLRLSSSSPALYEVRNTCAQPPCDPSRNHPAHPHAVAIPPPKHAELIALGIGFADFTPWRLALPLGPMCVVFHGGWSETALSCPTLYAMPRLIHPSPKPPAPQPMQ